MVLAFTFLHKTILAKINGSISSGDGPDFYSRFGRIGVQEPGLTCQQEGFAGSSMGRKAGFRERLASGAASGQE
jgi:hypothetical protein